MLILYTLVNKVRKLNKVNKIILEIIKPIKDIKYHEAKLTKYKNGFTKASTFITRIQKTLSNDFLKPTV
jgi:hypothetical protein